MTFLEIVACLTIVVVGLAVIVRIIVSGAVEAKRVKYDALKGVKTDGPF